MTQDKEAILFEKIDQIWSFVTETDKKVAVNGEKLSNHLNMHATILKTVVWTIGVVGGAFGIFESISRLTAK